MNDGQSQRDKHDPPGQFYLQGQSVLSGIPAGLGGKIHQQADASDLQQLERVTILYASGSGKCGHAVDDLCQLGDDHNHSQCTGGNDQQRCGFGAQLSHYQGKRGGAYRKTRDLKGGHASVQLEDRPHAGE